MDNFSADNRRQNPDIFDPLGGNAEDVVAQHDQIREPAARQRSLFALLKLGERRSPRIGRDGLVNRQLLFGYPAAGILPIEGRARDRSVESQHRIERRDIPVGSEGQPHSFVEQSLERVRRLDALGPNPLLRPAAIVNGVVRLHRRNHLERREAVEIFRRNMLRVFDSESPIAVTIRLNDVAEQIEDRRNAGVTDCMHAQLQAGVIRGHQSRPHVGERLHFVRKETTRLRCVGVGLEEIRGRRPERAVGVAFHGADTQPGRAERAGNTDLGLVEPAGFHWRGIDPGGQLVAIGEIRVHRHVVVRRIHVLHAGHAE